MQVLFPYAAERLQSHLEATYESTDTQKDVQLFREQVCCADLSIWAVYVCRGTECMSNTIHARMSSDGTPSPSLTTFSLPSQHHPPLRCLLQCICVICCHVVQMGDGAPAASANKATVIAAVVAAAKADMAADRKTTALKSLQVQDCCPPWIVGP